MAKKASEATLKNVLETAVELLQDAEDTGESMVTVSNSIYMRLRAAVKEATGINHGIAVDDESEEDEDEDDEDLDDEDS